MIRKTTRKGEYYTKLTKEDHATLKPGECFIRRDGKVFVQTSIASSTELSDSENPFVVIPYVDAHGNECECAVTGQNDAPVRVRHFLRENQVSERPYEGGTKIPLEGDWTQFSGPDVGELWRHVLNPDAYKSDWLLLRAKRCPKHKATFKRSKLTSLTDGELRSVAWFALLPDANCAATNEETHRRLIDAIWNEAHPLLNTFLDVWLREPDTVADLLWRLREYEKELDIQIDQVESDFLEYANKSLPDGDDTIKKRVSRARNRTKPVRIVQKAADILRRTLVVKGQKSTKKRP